MKKILIIIILLNSLFCYAQKMEINYLDELVKTGEIETSLSNFSTYLYAKDFIDKFNLSEKELELIGFWSKVPTTEIKQKHKNIEIETISFYPNRIGKIYCLLKNADTFNDSVEIYYEWKIDKGILFFSPFYILTNLGKKQNWEMVDGKYEKVWKVEDFNNRFVCDEIINYSFLNKYMHIENVEFHEDTVRLRIAKDPVKSIFDIMETNVRVKNFYLNENFSDLDNIKKSRGLLF